MKKISLKKSITLLMLFIISTVTFGQGSTKVPVNPQGDHTDEYYMKAIDFLQGDGILETWFTEGFLPLYDNFMKAEYGSFIFMGQAIAGLGAMLYLGYIGWQMVSGDKEWEILPMLKPFAIGLVLINWVSFVDLIKQPLISLQEASQESFYETQNELRGLRWQRYKKQQQLIDVVFEEQGKAQAEIEQQNAGNQTIIEEGLDILGEGLTALIAPVYELFARLQISMSLAVAALLETVGLWILRICTYVIFFIQLIFSTILIITGPISIGMSMIPGFSNSFNTWVARFINVNLYGFMAFIVLKIGTLLQIFAFEAEIERYNAMIASDGSAKSMEMIMTMLSSGNLSFGLVVITFVISGIGVLCVPTLANYVVSAGGNSGAMSKMKKAGMAVATSGKSLILKR